MTLIGGTDLAEVCRMDENLARHTDSKDLQHAHRLQRAALWNPRVLKFPQNR